MAFSVNFFVFLHLIVTIAVAGDKEILRRFLHGCFFESPCPSPSCFYITMGGEHCCGRCPEPPTTATTTTTTLGGPIDAHGPNCRYHGHVIPEGQNVTLPSGESVFCQYGGTYGGGIVNVVHPVVGQTCVMNNRTLCGPIPCPQPRCDKPLELTPGDCCEHCPTEEKGRLARVLVGGDHGDCQHPCTQGGVKYCHPIPCPLPPCVDRVTTKGECCSHCPNGYNCSGPDGSIIDYNHWKIVDGKNCTCVHPIQPATCV